MRVRMKTLAAGAWGVYVPGQVVEVPGGQGRTWIEKGYAEPVRFGREVAARLGLVTSVQQVQVYLSVSTMPVRVIPGIGAKRAAMLEEIGIETIGDLVENMDEVVAKLSVSEEKVREFLARVGSEEPSGPAVQDAGKMPAVQE